jgi:hypothetical protein
MAETDAAVVSELVAAGWMPSATRDGRWDDPSGKRRGMPPRRALEIARRDARRDAGESSQKETTT